MSLVLAALMGSWEATARGSPSVSDPTAMPFVPSVQQAFPTAQQPRKQPGATLLAVSPACALMLPSMCDAPSFACFCACNVLTLL